MLDLLSGETLLVPILGDPIGQVKSPSGVTAALLARGYNAVCVPMHVTAADVSVCLASLKAVRNVAGVIVTIPHKLAAFAACDVASERASFLRSVNTIVRAPDGRFLGDMFDGLGHVAACRSNGFEFSGRRGVLIGAGGAGTAIAHAAASAGLASLAIADADHARAADVAARLSAAGFDARPLDPAGIASEPFDIVMNATPLGMQPADPLPYPREALRPGMFVGDVITRPDPSPLIAAARTAGCGTASGIAMFEKVRDLMVDYLVAGMPPAAPRSAS